MKLAPPHVRTHRHSERHDAWPYLLLAASGVVVASLAWLLLRSG